MKVEEGNFFKEKLTPLVEKAIRDDLLNFALGIVASLGVSAKDTQ